MGDVLIHITTYIFYPFQIPQMFNSQQDSDYEPSLRSLLTSDEYFSTSEVEGGESLEKPRVMNLTDSYETLRLNRKTVPEQLKRKKLKKGEVVAFQENGVRNITRKSSSIWWIL